MDSEGLVRECQNTAGMHRHECEVQEMTRRRSGRSLSRFSILSLATLFMTGLAFAQGSDIYIYPAKGQSQAQQDKDRYECHSWAVQQTGFDPSKPQSYAGNSDTSQPYKP